MWTVWFVKKQPSVTFQDASIIFYTLRSPQSSWGFAENSSSKISVISMFCVSRENRERRTNQISVVRFWCGVFFQVVEQFFKNIFTEQWNSSLLNMMLLLEWEKMRKTKRRNSLSCNEKTAKIFSPLKQNLV